MASRNSRKIYIKNGYYHIYNRGVEKRIIYQDTQDYKVFLGYLKEYLSPKPKVTDIKRVEFSLRGQGFKAMPRLPNNYQKEIDLIAYSLLPNHFHFLIKQTENYSMKKFLHSLLSRYTKYFNKKYDRIGPLFQGRYRAVLVNDDRYLLHLSRYIHLNPSEYANNLTKAYSSYADYLGLRKTAWIKPNIILNFFNKKTLPEITKINSYKNFVETYKKDSTEVLGEMTLE
ncbi:transposase [Patescibacteria group bacterium]|nr:transposase [Patescibacteria group bacterium]